MMKETKRLFSKKIIRSSVFLHHCYRSELLLKIPYTDFKYKKFYGGVKFCCCFGFRPNLLTYQYWSSTFWRFFSFFWDDERSCEIKLGLAFFCFGMAFWLISCHIVLLDELECCIRWLANFIFIQILYNFWVPNLKQSNLQNFFTDLY